MQPRRARLMPPSPVRHPPLPLCFLPPLPPFLVSSWHFPAPGRLCLCLRVSQAPLDARRSGRSGVHRTRDDVSSTPQHSCLRVTPCKQAASVAIRTEARSHPRTYARIHAHRSKKRACACTRPPWACRSIQTCSRPSKGRRQHSRGKRRRQHSPARPSAASGAQRRCTQHRRLLPRPEPAAAR